MLHRQLTLFGWARVEYLEHLQRTTTELTCDPFPSFFFFFWTGIGSEDPRSCIYWPSDGYILHQIPYRLGDFGIRTKLLQKKP
jgi:hypothetical protein